LNGPYSIAVEGTGNILVLDQDFAGTGALIRVNLATGNRAEVFQQPAADGHVELRYAV
jgi:hypothetical protein